MTRPNSTQQSGTVIYERVDRGHVRIKVRDEKEWRKYPLSWGEAKEVADAYRAVLVEAAK